MKGLKTADYNTPIILEVKQSVKKTHSFIDFSNINNLLYSPLLEYSCTFVIYMTINLYRHLYG